MVRIVEVTNGVRLQADGAENADRKEKQGSQRFEQQHAALIL
jgi:hypothetical protein